MSNTDVYAPCPCGSGKKYKWCCRDKDREAQRVAELAPQQPAEVIEELRDGSKIVAHGGNTYRVSGDVDRSTLAFADNFFRQRGKRRGR